MPRGKSLRRPVGGKAGYSSVGYSGLDPIVEDHGTELHVYSNRHATASDDVQHVPPPLTYTPHTRVQVDGSPVRHK